MKYIHNTRQPLSQKQADKADKPFFNGSREKSKQDGDAFFQARKIDGNQDSALEREADAVAHKVTMAQQATANSSQRMGQMSVQKKGADEEKDAKGTQKKEQKDEKEEGKPQKKDEKKEEEKPTQKKEEDKKDKEPQKKEEDKKDKEGVQKKEEDKKDKEPQKKGEEDKKDEGKPQKKEKGEEKDDKAAAQKKEEKGGSVEKTEGKPEAPEAKFDRLLNESKGGGSPLPAKVRTQLEHQMNANFEQVKIHTGQQAVELCNLSKAQAFTHGNDIYFNAAKFDPESTAGMNLLAHELTHVVQQNGPRK
ncbi:eCIS core domain-containing protein [Mucilaginibacter sp. SJ]|uniref:eCIS core domain-containing protein n=1 Tax=Mucilaginibacter sp. SJ TaxID=3029053 RepID=UPI0023AA15A8|nr:DUF4157 domain-containing protein [Mucilaginibacter sp. SJ]WEA02822.1 DUF4157 domain-containing protein [Mucilaginibacter sp. SJ]